VDGAGPEKSLKWEGCRVAFLASLYPLHLVSGTKCELQCLYFISGNDVLKIGGQRFNLITKLTK
jgi:hypothetical protein